MKILIFGGTTEGRVLSEKLSERIKTNRIKEGSISGDEADYAIDKNENTIDRIVVSVASDYGEKMLHDISGIEVHVGRMERDEMVTFIKENSFDTVIDATHPFAALATANIKAACEESGVRYLRLRREDDEAVTDAKDADIIYCDSCDEAAMKLRELIEDCDDGTQSIRQQENSTDKSLTIYSDDKNILLTTGSKELKCFTSLISSERIFVRVIPSEESIEKCLTAGIDRSHIIAEMGPFSYDENIKHITEHNITFLVTKESGNGSGYSDKLRAAADKNIISLVIKRADHEGKSMSEILELIC